MAPAEPGDEPGGLASGGQVAVEVMVGVAPREIVRMALSLPAGSTVRQALDAAKVWGLADALDLHGLESGAWSLGVWGRRERLGHVLRDQDRVELVRPLIVDPKEARRVRYRAHGEKLPRGIQRAKPR